MPTRYGDEALSRDWLYPADLAGFLRSIGTSRDDPHEAKTRVELFLLTHGGKRMPAALRAQLIAEGLLTATAPVRPEGNQR